MDKETKDETPVVEEEVKSPNFLAETVGPDKTTLNANGFVGVSPEYQNFTNDTDEPLGEGDDYTEEEEPVKAATPAPAAVKPVAAVPEPKSSKQ